MTRWDKSKLPSRHTTVGPTSAPHRAFYYAMGMSDEEVEQPFVGVATTWNEAAPCNITLMRQAQAAKKGVKAAGGTPREFTTITVTDGIAMGHAGMKSSLVSREVIADSVELTMRGHCYDGLVGLAGCDKSLPGMMMAMVRLNVPSVFMYGGSIMPGRYKNRDVTIVDVFEGVGANSAGAMSDDELSILEHAACPSGGSCGGQFTANTMATVSEAMGLALPNSAMTPAPFESRDTFAEASGQAVMRLIKDNLRPIMRIALPAIATQLATPFAIAYMTRITATFGNDAVAAVAVVNRLVPVAFGVIFSLSGAVGPIIGQNYGAGKLDRVRQALKDALLFAAFYTVSVSVLLLAVAGKMPAWFSATPAAAELITFYYTFIAITWAFAGAQFVAQAAFNNLDRPQWSMWFNWGKATIGTIPLLHLGAAWGGATGTLIGMGAVNVIFGLAAAVTAYTLVRNLASRDLFRRDAK